MSIGAAAGKNSTRPTNPSPPSNNATGSQSSNSSSAPSSDAKSDSTAGTQSGESSQDSSEISTEAQNKPATPKTEAEQRRAHLQALEDNYSIFDNPDGGEHDGVTGLGDIERIAKGELNEDEAREALRQQGVDEDKIDERLDSIKGTAQFLMEDEEFRESIDTANDNNGEGDPDGKIGRGDLDRAVLASEEEERREIASEAERQAQAEPTEQELAEAQEAVDRWQNPETFENELQNRSLSDFSSAEMDALVALSENSSEAQAQVEEAVLNSVNSTESLEQMPDSEAYSFLLDKYVTGREVPEDQADRENDPTVQAQNHIDGLIEEQVNGTLDRQLQGRSGDDDLGLAQDRVVSELETLAMKNPALAEKLQNQTEQSFENYSDKFTDVARSDDNFLQRVNHSITGGIRDGVGFVADKYRDTMHSWNDTTSGLAKRVSGLMNDGLDLAGRVGERGLDLVGAEGVGDNVRNLADQTGDMVEATGVTVADQVENFGNGLVESVAGTAEGLAYVATDPVGTVEGIVEAVKDPSLLLEGYKETLNEHGVAGLAGQITGDLALTLATGGAGAATKTASTAGRIAKFARQADNGNGGGNIRTRLAQNLDNAGHSDAARRVADFQPVNKLSERLGQRVHDTNTPGRQALGQINDQLAPFLDDVNKGKPVDPATVNNLLADPKFSETLSKLDREGADIPIPEGVQVLASGRGEILRELASQGVSNEKFTRLAADLLDTGSLNHKAYLLDLPEGASIGRRYSSDGELRANLGLDAARENGGYWTWGDDVTNGSGFLNRIRSALPSFNKADRSKVGDLANSQVAVLTKIAPMQKFGLHALGGDLQLQPTDYLKFVNEVRRTHTSPHLHDFATPLPPALFEEDTEEG